MLFLGNVENFLDSVLVRFNFQSDAGRCQVGFSLAGPLFVAGLGRREERVRTFQKLLPPFKEMKGESKDAILLFVIPLRKNNLHVYLESVIENCYRFFKRYANHHKLKNLKMFYFLLIFFI